MRIGTISRENTIAVAVAATSGITVFFKNDPALLQNIVPTDSSLNWVNAYLSELYATTTINSLAEIALPNYADSDTQIEQVTKTLQMQWGSPRYELCFYIRKSDTSPWIFKGKVSLLHQAGSPYVSYRPLDFYTDNLARGLEQGASLGVGYNDCGYGLPGNNDSVQLDGSIRQEATITQPDIVPTVIVLGGTVQQVTQYSNTSTVTATAAARQAVGARSTRINVVITNNSSSTPVYYSFTSNVSATSNNGTIPAGGSRTFASNTDQTNYQSSIYVATASGTASLTVVEVYVQ